MKEILGKASLEGLLDSGEEREVRNLALLYREYEAAEDKEALHKELQARLSRLIGKEERIKVYPASAESSRIIAKARAEETSNTEFIYCVQRAYELLFRFTFLDGAKERSQRLVKTPVGTALHYFPAADLGNITLCVMLRGALLPSMVIGKEIQDFSPDGHIAPFALFSVKRQELGELSYVLDLGRSYFSLESLDGRDLVFADPMNATGGSFITILRYLEGKGVRPRSVKFLNLIAAPEGLLRSVHAFPYVEAYAFWADPCLNDRAYILPGLGDAGDRLNGADIKGKERNIIQLAADYGPGIISLYRDQVREIEKTVLG